MIFEVCTGTLLDVHNAIEGGAKRIELCAALATGGITPSLGLVRRARMITEDHGVRLHVLIRPREGNFLYTKEEIEIMVDDILSVKELGVDGIVTGAMNAEGLLDMGACRRFVEAAEGISTTFSRAFDTTTSPFEALEQIIEAGFDRLLTSGVALNAPKGVEMIGQLVERAAGRIKIMAGAGINELNFRQVRDLTGVDELHGSLRSSYPDESAALPEMDKGFISATDINKVAAIVEALNTD